MLIERILTPLDGSPTAEAVLPHVRRLVRKGGSELILVRAAEPPYTDNYLSVYEAALAAAREYLLGVKDRLEAEGLRVRIVTRVGPAAGTILDVAGEEKATLIALATHGRTGLARLLLGSVAEQVLRKGKVPVFGVRPFDLPGPKAEEPSFRRILVPLDLSPVSVAALPRAVEFAKLFGSALVLLTVVEPGAASTAVDVQLPRQKLEEEARKIQSAGLPVSALVEEGDATTRILEACRAHGIDLIAMSTHGRTGLARVAMGSVTEKVLRQAPVPILAVRPETAPA